MLDFILLFRKPGNALALETAKRNLVERYLVVGQTDRIRDLITVLEKTLPNFLKDAGQHFDQLDGKIILFVFNLNFSRKTSSFEIHDKEGTPERTNSFASPGPSNL